jgi:release factor glutamine methyltransferase
MRTTFYDLPFETAPGRVFKPRAATEALVDAALQRIDGQPLRVADVGTGSGAIAVALAVNRPQVEVWATDTSPEAVALARENAERNGVADRVHVIDVLLQFHGQPFAADCWQLEDLRAELENAA